MAKILGIVHIYPVNRVHPVKFFEVLDELV